MKALICGAGVAGLTTALCLARAGHEVILLEKSPVPRDGGYMIDFFGPGFDAGEELGLLPDLERIHYPITSLSFVDHRGDERLGLPYRKMRKQLFGDRHFNFLRGDVERVLRENLPDVVDTRYAVSIDSVRKDDHSVAASLTDGSSEQCDIVIGADGLHSKVCIPRFAVCCSAKSSSSSASWASTPQRFSPNTLSLVASRAHFARSPYPTKKSPFIRSVATIP